MIVVEIGNSWVPTRHSRPPYGSNVAPERGAGICEFQVAREVPPGEVEPVDPAVFSHEQNTPLFSGNC